MLVEMPAYHGLLANKIQKVVPVGSIFGEKDGRGQITYGSDNSLNVNWNADNGFNVNNWNRSEQNWNLGALPEVSFLS